MHSAPIAALALCALIVAETAGAGQKAPPEPSAAPTTRPAGALPSFGGPPAPVAPEVIARDAAGRATVRAVRITAPLRLDGKLDEAIYAALPPISDFVQREPVAGAPATEKTEAWVLFDNSNIYVSVRCWDSHMERIVANEMRHDNSSVYNGNDNIIFILDTFYDRRNGVSFAINPIGGRAEGQVTNERTYNGDYNVVWDVSVGRFEGGWAVEAAIPFKSLRYRSMGPQVWGFNMARDNRSKNESSYLVAMPKALGQRALMQVSMAPTLVGVEVPGGLKNLDIKPYAISNLTSDLAARPRISNDLSGDVGVDVKYGITQNVTADLTYNTDFAQVEADEQQVNLTRFSLFFPEKRDFFLENKGTFDFGGVGTSGSASSTDTPTLFYSRRIGLYQGRSVPIQGGGRLTGRVGRTSFGLLNIQSDEDTVVGATRTNFAVARLRRDILRRSSIGALVTRRSVREQGAGANEAYGADGTFAFFDNLIVNTYWARTHTTGLAGEDTSYRGQLDYVGDRYGVQLEHLLVGDHFNPEVGFLRRDNMRKSYGFLRFSPRPKRIKAVRKFTATASLNYIESAAGHLETRDVNGEFDVELQNSDKLTLLYDANHEFLSRPFRIAPTVTLPVGSYDFGVGRAAYLFGAQRKTSGTVSVEYGTFYSGHRTTIGVASGRVELTPRFSLQPTALVNLVDLPQGSFTTRLVGSRVTFTMTPFMFVSALLQYNSSSSSLSSNVRLRWEYHPGSELFVVYNDQRDTLARSFPGLVNRAVIVKINRLFRF